MKKGIRAVLIALPLVILAGIAVFLLCCSREGFTGSRVKKPDCYLLDIERMSGTDQHSLKLDEGDVLKIHFETSKGSIRMEIQAPDGTAIYSGNGKELTDFTVNIPKSGLYTIVVEAAHARGTLHIQIDE